MDIHTLTERDFHLIHSDLRDFWGENVSEVMAYAHHPMFLHEFGDTAFVIREEGRVVAYLCGFLAPASKTGYVHLIGVRASHRRGGLAKALYARFESELRKRGAVKLKAITRPNNSGSIEFHKSIGMSLLGEPNELGINVVKEYSGRGEDRVVFEMVLSPI